MSSRRHPAGRIKGLEEQLLRVREERKKLLKTYHGVKHEDASSEAKYMKLKILDDRILGLIETIEELKKHQLQPSG